MYITLCDNVKQTLALYPPTFLNAAMFQVYELSCQLQKSQSEEELATHKLSKMDAEVKVIEQFEVSHD